MEREVTVATPRDEVSSANQRGELPRDLLGGTVAMQQAGARYVPKGHHEVDSVWQARIKAAVLVNIYKRTVGMLSGQVFSRDVSLDMGEGKDIPDPFASMREDIDLQGNGLSVWAAKFFEDAMNRGAAVLLVDFPHVTTRKREDGALEYQGADGAWKPKTAQADAENGWRPYFVHIRQTDLLGWRHATVNGCRVLTQLRFRERVTEEGGAWDVEDHQIDQVRVLYPGRWEVWREVESGTNKKEWRLHDSGTTSLKVIPAIPLILGESEGGMCANPALEDLAHLNRRHWQATVDQYDLISWMRRPVWVGQNLLDGEGNPISSWGPASLLNSTGDNVKLESVSVSPEAVSSGQEELDNLKAEMSMFGMRLLMPRDVETTATTDRLNAAENDSTLKKWAMALKDVLEQGFVFAGMWVNITEDGVPSVAVNTEFHLLAGMTVDEIKAAVDMGIVSKRLAFDELKRRGLVPDDADWLEIQVEIENDARQASGPSLGAGLAGAFFGNQGQAT